MATLMKDIMQEALGDLPPTAIESLIKSKAIEREDLLSQVDSCLDSLGKDKAAVLNGEKSVVDHLWRHRVEAKVRHLRRNIQTLEREIGEHKRDLAASTNSHIENKLNERIEFLVKEVNGIQKHLFPLIELVINKFPNCQTIGQARELVKEYKQQVKGIE